MLESQEVTSARSQMTGELSKDVRSAVQYLEIPIYARSSPLDLSLQRRSGRDTQFGAKIKIIRKQTPVLVSKFQLSRKKKKVGVQVQATSLQETHIRILSLHIHGHDGLHNDFPAPSN